MTELLHKELTDRIIRCYYNVYNAMGFGFLEKVYENSMLIELRDEGLQVQKQKQIPVCFKDNIVGIYFADIIVEEKVILELKAIECLSKSDECQLMNYLKATEIEVGIVFNFGKKPEFKRKVFMNYHK